MGLLPPPSPLLMSSIAMPHPLWNLSILVSSTLAPRRWDEWSRPIPSPGMSVMCEVHLRFKVALLLNKKVSKSERLPRHPLLLPRSLRLKLPNAKFVLLLETLKWLCLLLLPRLLELRLAWLEMWTSLWLVSSRRKPLNVTLTLFEVVPSIPVLPRTLL